MPTMTHTIKWTRGSDTLSVDENYTGTDAIDDEVPLAAGVVNQALVKPITIAVLQYLLMIADQNVTIKTNSSGSPQETINLIANKPFVFRTGDYRGAVFLGNITQFFLSNPGSIATIFKMKGLQNL
jgi:hypothetical protein